MSETFHAPDGKLRCSWAGAAPEFLDYHDEEWGFPVCDDHRLFEKLCLEGFQSGLSWRTILNKRAEFRKVFRDFNIEKVARFGAREITAMLGNAGIVRHRGKIEAAINNAQRCSELIEREGSLASFIWGFEADPKSRPKKIDAEAQRRMTTSPESTALSKSLKKQGWKFVGPTTMYAFMQSMGLVNDHHHTCIVSRRVEQARKKFKRPTG